MIFPFLLVNVDSQAPYYPNHYYGESSVDITSHKVPPRERWPEPRKDPLKATLAPHVCGFNPYTRECMDPENHCPGRCINFNYIYNARYDCRCLVV
uniref:Uncharacterized protein n=1 Tax=Acrobeloides nanus TaxID=290746 RepID=A0A914C4C7_9BILA